MMRREYFRQWGTRKHLESPMIPCACGCGLAIHSRTAQNRSVRYALGHWRLPSRVGQPAANRLGTSQEKSRRAWAIRRARFAQADPISCQCGCGGRLPSLNATGQPARYIRGHNPGGLQTRFQRGQATWNKGRPHPTIRQGNRTSRAKAGRREDLGGQFFRSRWEANFARYLASIGQRYRYEPAVYVIHLPDGSAHAYRPDFLIETREFVEIKGWVRSPHILPMLEAARTQLPYPIRVIFESEYRALERRVAARIPFWEWDRPRQQRSNNTQEAA